MRVEGGKVGVRLLEGESMDQEGPTYHVAIRDGRTTELESFRLFVGRRNTYKTIWIFWSADVNIHRCIKDAQKLIKC